MINAIRGLLPCSKRKNNPEDDDDGDRAKKRGRLAEMKAGVEFSQAQCHMSLAALEDENESVYGAMYHYKLSTYYVDRACSHLDDDEDSKRSMRDYVEECMRGLQYTCQACGKAWKRQSVEAG